MKNGIMDSGRAFEVQNWKKSIKIKKFVKKVENGGRQGERREKKRKVAKNRGPWRLGPLSRIESRQRHFFSHSGNTKNKIKQIKLKRRKN